jgi:hypothetical protein
MRKKKRFNNLYTQQLLNNSTINLQLSTNRNPQRRDPSMMKVTNKKMKKRRRKLKR